MHVVQEKDALVETGEQLLHRLLVKLLASTGRNAFESFEHSRFVAFSLQATDKPCACVRESFVIEIDRILRGEHNAETKRASLFQKCQERQLRRRIRDRREVTKDLVHVENRAQARRA